MLEARLNGESMVTENCGISPANQIGKSGELVTHSFFGGGDIDAKLSTWDRFSK